MALARTLRCIFLMFAACRASNSSSRSSDSRRVRNSVVSIPASSKTLAYWTMCFETDSSHAEIGVSSAIAATSAALLRRRRRGGGVSEREGLQRSCFSVELTGGRAIFDLPGVGLVAEGVASAARAAAEGDAMAAMSRPLKANRPSKVRHDERRSLATGRAAVGTRHAAGTVDVATKAAAETAAGGSDMTAAASAATDTKGTEGGGCKAKRRRRVDKYAAKARTTAGTEPL